jgi:hypothetical protein
MNEVGGWVWAGILIMRAFIYFTFIINIESFEIFVALKIEVKVL